MTRRDALIELRDKVKAGQKPTTDDIWRAFSNNEKIGVFSLQVTPAYNGSLDAAKALHEAVLPGFTVRLTAQFPADVSAPYAHVFRMRKTEEDDPLGGSSSGYAGTCQARAWLLAILDALIAMESIDG